MRWTFLSLLALFFIFGNYSWTELWSGLKFYGSSIFPSHPNIGITLIFIGLYAIIFTDETIWLYNKYIKGKRFKFKD